MNTVLIVRVDWMDALLALLLVSVGFGLFIFVVNRSVKYVALAALSIVVIAVAMVLGGSGW
jgi:hypothetical protein